MHATAARGQGVIPHGKQNVHDVTLCPTKRHTITHQSPKKHAERKAVGAMIVAWMSAAGEHLRRHVRRSSARLGETAAFVGMNVCSESPAWLRCRTRAQTCPASTRLLHTVEMPSKAACASRSSRPISSPYDPAMSCWPSRTCPLWPTCAKGASRSWPL